VEAFWQRVLQHQQASGFSDIAGAHASVVLPVSDRLVSRLVAERASPDWPVSVVEVRAEAADRFVVSLRLKGPTFLPLLRVRFEIERQPELPSSPVLVLRIVPDALTAVATPFLRFLKRLPEGVGFDGSRLTLHLWTILSGSGIPDEVRQRLTSLAIHAEEGRFVLQADAQV